MRNTHEIILPVSDASVNHNSLPGVLADVWGYSIQVIITGSATGTVTLQGSSDAAPNANFQAANYPVVNWTDIANSAEPVTGAGTIAYDVVKTGYNFVRVVYTAASGTGTIMAQIVTKGF